MEGTLHTRYSITSTLFENDYTIIYRARSRDVSGQGAPVILKTHKRPEDLVKITHEYQLLQGKRLAGISNVLDVIHSGNEGSYLVSEDEGYMVLAAFLTERTLSAEELARVLVSAAHSLQEIHSHGLLHRDIKPANMLIHPETLEIHYIDFGISIALADAQREHTGAIAGTLEYMAPEQTGRLGVTADCRSDLYSLGITLYYAIVGRLPFLEKSAMEYIHAHIAVAPQPVAELVELPGLLSEMIMRLLEKRPEKRYQTAAALAHDGERFLDSYSRDGAHVRFMLGEQDIFHNLHSNHKLYGKARPQRELGDAISRINKKNSEIVLLSGPLAAGKSSIISHVLASLDGAQVLCFRTEFEEGAHADPYASIRNTFSGFEQAIYRARVPLSFFRDQLLVELGDSVPLLCNLLPSLRSLLGVAMEEETARAPSALQMQQAFRTFIQILSSSAVPLILVVENLQWADEAALALLLAIFEAGTQTNTLFIVTYRENSSKRAAELLQFLEKRRSNRLQVTKISVSPLTIMDIAGIIDDVLPQNKASAQRLAEVAYDYCRGNIRSLLVFLKDLYRSGALSYLEREGRWHWTRQRVAPSASATESMLAQLAALPADTQKALLLCACIGRTITIEHLTAALGSSATLAQAQEHLRLAANADLLSLVEDVYLFDSAQVRNAVLSSVPQEQRQAAYYAAGRNTFETFQDNEYKLMQYCATITEQYQMLAREQVPLEDQLIVFRLNLLAGDQAMDSANPQRALEYYEVALSFLPEDVAPEQRETALRLKGQYAAALFDVQREEDSIAAYRRLFTRCRTEEERYNAYRQLIRQYHVAGNWSGAYTFASEYLQDSALLAPEDPIALAAITAERRQQALSLMALHRDDILIDVPLCTDETISRQGSMIAVLCESMLLLHHDASNYYLYTGLVMLVSHGAFPDFAMLCGVAMEQCAHMNHHAMGKTIFESACALARRYRFDQGPLWAFYCSMLAHWVEPLDQLPELFRQGKAIALQEGVAYYCSCLDMALLEYELYTDTPLRQITASTEAALYTAEKYHIDNYQLIFRAGFRQFARCLTGKTIGRHSFEDRTFREADMLEQVERVRWEFVAQIYYVLRMKALFFAGEHQLVLDEAAKLDAILPTLESRYPFLFVIDFYYYRVFAQLRLAEASGRTDFQSLIAADLLILEKLAAVKPENFQPKLELIHLAAARITSGNLQLIQRYSKVHAQLKELRCQWDCAMIEEAMIYFWRALGVEQYCNMHTKNALHAFDAVGAKLKVYEFMGDEVLRTGQTTTLLSTTILTHSDFTSSNLSGSMSLDYQTILGVIASLAGESKLEDMMNELLGILMKNGGAEQAQLFIIEDGVAYLRAFRSSDRATRGLITQNLPLPLAQTEESSVPRRLIELAIRRKQRLVATSIDNEYVFLGDVYLEQYHPESFLVLPIVTGGRFFGVVYLENTNLPGVFMPERENFLAAIVTQAAILLQNAINVEALANYTEDLEGRLNGHLGQLNTLIAGIAHEVNSPLGVCVTISSAQRERTQEVLALYQQRQLGKNALEEYLAETDKGNEILYNNVVRAGELVKNFKKIAVDQSNVVFEDLDLMQVLSDAWEYVRPAVKRQIERCTITGPSRVHMRTSNGVMAQIFTNLIMNSSIHGFAGREKSGCFVTIHVEDYGNEVTITYQDNGRGMSPEESDQVFLPFYTTRRGDGGSGLGGHIILTLVTQSLSGSIQCTSRVGVGTTYLIKIPKNPERRS